MKRNEFLWQIINSCHKISILVARNQFLVQEINSWYNKSILVTRNRFFSQEINCCHKKSILVTRNLLYQFATTRESYQKLRLSINISWEPGSQWIHRPGNITHTIKNLPNQSCSECTISCGFTSFKTSFPLAILKVKFRYGRVLY